MDEISAIAEDYLKVIWAAPEWGGRPMTTKALADRFGTTPATASDTVRRLTAQGLLSHEPYREIVLTAEGERHATGVVRRHRLIETFLVSQLGYSWAEVHDEAERLEHAASELMIDRIDDLLGRPAHDPHGDPIPTKSGAIEYPADAVRLSDAMPGNYTVSRVSDADSDRLEYFHAVGLTPGRPIIVVRDAPARGVVVDVAEGARLALAAPAAEAVILVPAIR